MRVDEEKAGIWRREPEEERAGEKVLANCDETTVTCWYSLDSALKVAVFLQRHDQEREEGGDPVAKVRIAYRTFHPAPIPFQRSFESNGGRLERHDAAQWHQMLAGGVPKKRIRCEIVPDAVKICRGENGATIDARIKFGETDLPLDATREARVQVAFPEEDFECSCC